MSFDHPVQAADAFYAAWNARDADTLAGLFVREPDFINVSGMWWRDRAQIRKAHKKAFKGAFKNRHIQVIARSVKYMTPDVATVFCAWEIYKNGDKAGAPEHRGVQLFVVIRNKTGWLIQAMQNTEGRDMWPPIEIEDGT